MKVGYWRDKKDNEIIVKPKANVAEKCFVCKFLDKIKKNRYACQKKRLEFRYQHRAKNCLCYRKEKNEKIIKRAEKIIYNAKTYSDAAEQFNTLLQEEGDRNWKVLVWDDGDWHQVVGAVFKTKQDARTAASTMRATGKKTKIIKS